MIIQARWDEVNSWSNQRGTKIRGALDDLRANAMLLDQLIGWLTTAEANLKAQSQEFLPENLPIIEQLLHDHQVETCQYLFCLCLLRVSLCYCYQFGFELCN